ncbi:MAG: 50S ribosomal protein L18 [Candidatus Aenigmarchaeota archaeon]|nr:50S ribosomal protein L18 [Candidatus Aenigmarchaeota archaeon]
MARGRTHIVPHRRRREGKTDYRRRLALVKSKKLRFVVRKTNQSVICQIVEYDHTGDKTLLTVTSFDLKALGWTGPTGNIPAAYLTGMLCAKKAAEKKVREAILDIGLFRATKGNRLFAALKGAVDGGLSIPHSKEAFPSEERIAGRHIPEPAGAKVQKEFDEVRKKIGK